MLADSILEGLNPEQREAVTSTEGPLLVLAGAGSGKTRVLVHRIAWLVGVCGIPPEGILSVTFTNKAAGEMRERVEKLLGPEGEALWCSTFHSACVRILRREAGHLNLSRGFAIYDDDDSRQALKEVLRRKELDPKTHDPRRLRWRIDQFKNQGILPAAAAEQATDMDAELTAELYAGYQRILAENEALDFGDLLLQTTVLFQQHPEVLAHYRRRWQYVLVDEYQDTNRVQYNLVTQLVQEHQNLCAVGDPDQCLPPTARVRTEQGERPICEIRAGDRVIVGSGHGRTTSAPVEKVMTRGYAGRMLRIQLRSGRVLEATPNHMCFGRLDPVPGLHYVYLMWRRDKGYRIGTTSGVRTSKDSALKNGIMVRSNQEVADRVWIARACSSLGDARFYEQLYSVRYGIPTMVFHVRGRRMAVEQEHVDRLFDQVDTETGALKLMRDLDLDPRYPHHRPFAVRRGEINRRYVWFTMFGSERADAASARCDHRVQLITSDPELRAKAEGRFPVRAGNKDTWRIETARKDYDAGLELAEQICALDDLELVSRARLTLEPAFHFMPASHLCVGMTVPVWKDGEVREDAVERVESVPYEGDVYDLSIPDFRNFISEGVLVHNSIYAWRNADIRNILDFERDFPEAKVVRLERNYRSTQPILSGAVAVVSNNVERLDKALYTEREEGERIRVYHAMDDRDEAQFAVRQIIEEVRKGGRPYRDFAIFYRTNAQSRPFEEEFLKYDVPYTVVGGVRFYARAEVKDALAYLRAALNPADSVAVRRIVNNPPRGIGKATVERAATAADAAGVSLLEGLRIVAGEGGRAGSKVADFLNVVDGLARELPELSPAEAIARVLDRSGYLRNLEQQGTTEAEGRLENLRELLAGADDFARANSALGDDERSALELFLEEVALVADIDQADTRADRVSMMTVHSAKGLEYPVVFLVGLEEGIFPHSASARDERGVEEERRLCYVGMTRAMERLTISCAEERRRFGSRSYQVPSRFLSEIPEELVEGELPGGPKPARGGDYNIDYSYAQESAGEGSTLGPGLRVRHPIFGEGTVMQVAGSGQGQKLRIRFDRVGIKTVLVRFANLEVV